ncbi:MAG TPA: FAD-dependent thymidylate synthase [Pyrodictium delaneyi]|uniref:Flavin-dependent thymidylate synthase n=1 Tax=Pyrodictium delaneyi TaxID=1273541 RepID=A0A833EBH4_9CREN|nr:FAD-dependent thymidylate synthase [Pyrodictium delaneyi]
MSLLEATPDAASTTPPVSVRLISYTRDAPRLVAAAARITVSKKPVEKAWEMQPSDIEKWIRELVRRGHGSPLEHAVYTFEAVCSRVCSHQLVRHRIASYTQQSMRYTEGFLRSMVLEICSILGVDCPEKPSSSADYTVYGSALSRAAELVQQALAEESSRVHVDGIVVAVSKAYVINPKWNMDTVLHQIRVHLSATAAYYEMLAKGVPREDARLVLPHAVRTRVVFTMNARELLESFLPLRMCSHAQWEIRMLAWSVYDQLVKVHPEIFQYAGPRCVLQENRVRVEPCSLDAYLLGQCVFTIERCPELVPRKGIQNCLRYARDSSRYAEDKTASA